jgi:hypothetical protein
VAFLLEKKSTGSSLHTLLWYVPDDRNCKKQCGSLTHYHLRRTMRIQWLQALHWIDKTLKISSKNSRI